MTLYSTIPRITIPRICLLLWLVLLFCGVYGQPIAPSSSLPSLNPISDDGVNVMPERQSATPASENGLNNEVLPTEETLVSTTRRVPTSSTTDPVPELNRDRVSLALPDDLFSSAANLTLQLRNFIGDFISNTSVRIAQVVRLFQPLFGYHLMIDIPKELDV